jgi:pimeloyl-ACP methyl ester carboxylesterase
MRGILRALGLAVVAGAAILSSNAATAAPDANPTSKVVDVGNGVALHYVEQGRGTPLILVHGSLSDGRYWNEAASDFAKHYRVIAYSRRYNFPNTNPSRSGYSAIADADDLSALISRLRLGKVYVVGHSYGAFAALFLAVKHPEQLRKVVLAEPPAVSLLNDLPGDEAPIGHATYADIQRRMVKPMEAEFRKGEREAGVATFVDYVFNDPRAWDKFSTSSKQATMLDAHEWDVMMTRGTLFPHIDPAAVSLIRLPVLIMSGGKSYPFLRLIDRELARLIPGSKHFVLPRDGHQMWYQDPVLCARTVEAFLHERH